PIGMALLTFRFLQIAWQIITGKLDRMIAGHEAEEDLEALKAELSEADEAMMPKTQGKEK
ncbi:TRAP transporter small permease, partial [Vibrio cholerae]|nr:TRAP transporter small permease [Vibrio cholerae]